VGVGYMKSHEGLYQEVARLLRENVLGALRSFDSSCYLSQVLAPKTKGWIHNKQLSGGGMLINSTCHLIHSLHCWFGPARAVTATCKSVFSTDVDDDVSAEIEYASVTGRLQTSWSVPGYDVETSSLRVEGEAGSLEIENDRVLRMSLNRPSAGLDKGTHEWPRVAFERADFNLSPNYGGEGYYREDADFVQACAEKRPARVSWEEGLAVQRIIDGIYRSNGQRVELNLEATP
jgi:predicted dehydrogenase